MAVADGWRVTVDGEDATLADAALSVDGTELTFTISIDNNPVQDGAVVRYYYNEVEVSPQGTLVAIDGGVALAAISDQPVTNGSDVQIPELTAAVVAANGTQVAVTSSKALLAADFSGFTITADTDPVELLAASLSNDGLTLTLTVDAIYDDAVVSVVYNPIYGALQSAASGDAALAASITATNNSTRVAPTVVRALVLASGTTLEVYFSERIASSTPELGWTINDTTLGETISIASATVISVNGTNDGIRLVLSEAIYAGDVVTLDYSSASGDVVSHANNLIEVASFTGHVVSVSSGAVPLTLVVGSSSLAADGTSLTLTFNSTALSGSSSLGFTITVNGVAASLSGGGSLASGVITRTLASAAYAGDVIGVIYDDDPGTLVSGIRTLYSFGPTNIANNSEVLPYAPEDLFAADAGWYYEPAKSGGAFSDIAMSDEAGDDGDRVGVIADLSGNGYHLVLRNTSSPYATLDPSTEGATFSTDLDLGLPLLGCSVVSGQYRCNAASVPAVSTTADFTRYIAVAFGDSGSPHLFPWFLSTRLTTGVETTKSMIHFGVTSSAPVGEVTTLYASVGTQVTPPSYQYNAVLPSPRSRTVLVRLKATGGVFTFSIAGTDYVWDYSSAPAANMWYSGSSYRFVLQSGGNRAYILDFAIDRLLTGQEESDFEAYILSRYPFLEAP